MVLKVETIGSPILREECSPVPINELKCDDFFGFVLDMHETMDAEEGIGLAANQVGVNKRLITLRLSGGMRLAMVNPIILSSKRWGFSVEGCLSIPDKLYKLQRAAEIRVRFTDLQGKEREIVIDDDIIARVVQHEVDHLDGVLICDTGELVGEPY